MGRRIIRGCIAAALAAATIGLVSSLASAAAGRPRATGSIPPAASRYYAGYEASGRDFRYATALIRVPDVTPSSFYPQIYVQLSEGSLASGAEYTREGIEPCTIARVSDPALTCAAGSWAGFIETFNNSITGTYYTHFVPLSVSSGDGVDVSIFFDQAGNELHYVLTPPTPEACSTGPQNQCFFNTQAYGPIFDHASGLVDFTNSAGAVIPPPPPARQFRITQFLGGALTTYRGNRGSWAGPWPTREIDATTNGLPYPQGHVVLSPSYLWSDGLTANGAVRSGDAFGVWART
jgi:hypothetical protein